MITRNFYRLDEVESSLIWCILHNRVEESLFWCLELIESGLGVYALQTMVKTWIYFVGIGSLTWFEAVVSTWKSDEIQEETILLLCYQLATLPPESHDCTPLCLCILGLQQYKEPPNYVIGPLKDKTLFQKSILQGKLELSWQYVLQDWQQSNSELEILVPQEYINLLEKILQIQESFELSYDLSWMSRALALCFVFVVNSKKFLTLSKKLLQPHISDRFTEKISEWRSLCGKRKRRIFSTTLDSLAWITQRGRKSCYSTNINEIREIWKFIDPSVPCWESVNFSIEDEAYEELMDSTFPDDIPDEWSAEDQKKSHGPGVLQKNEQPNYSKFLRKWLRLQSSKILWKAVKKSCDLALSHKLLADKKFFDFDPDFQSLYKNPSVPCIPTKPVKIILL